MKTIFVNSHYLNDGCKELLEKKGFKVVHSKEVLNEGDKGKVFTFELPTDVNMILKYEENTKVFLLIHRNEIIAKVIDPYNSLGGCIKVNFWNRFWK